MEKDGRMRKRKVQTGQHVNKGKGGTGERGGRKGRFGQREQRTDQKGQHSSILCRERERDA